MGGEFMMWEFSKDKPIYVQIIENMQKGIISGKYKPGDKLPPVREMAVLAAVNPNTMQRALQELEKERLLFTKRTSGRFITEDTDMIEELKENFVRKQIFDFYKKMKSIGLTKQEIIIYVNKAFEEVN